MLSPATDPERNREATKHGIKPSISALTHAHEFACATLRFNAISIACALVSNGAHDFPEYRSVELLDVLGILSESVFQIIRHGCDRGATVSYRVGCDGSAFCGRVEDDGRWVFHAENGGCAVVHGNGHANCGGSCLITVSGAVPSSKSCSASSWHVENQRSW
mmetsp:Transcript_67970/g.112990  ORF Transcript_67970/g.112990 Transcript_67970/m.112990 type:complete len:162 (+) Transcript_67970:458-943(+)